MLRLSGLTRIFPGMDHPAVDHLNLEIADGEIVALAGASGSGKTTTLRMIAGFDDPDNGSIALDDEVLADARGSVVPERRNIGVVFQDFALFPHLTVEQNVAFGIPGRTNGVRRSPRGARVEREREHADGTIATTAVLDRVYELLEMAGIAELGARYPHEISGGQQQRVALVRALAPRPRVILLDEPFSNLDHTCTHRLLAETRQLLTSSGSTAIVVTHDRYEAFTLSDRIAVLENGRLEQVGSAEEIYARPASRHVAEFSGSASFVPVRAGADGRWESSIGRVPDDVAVVEEGEPLAVVRPHQLRVSCGPCEDADTNAEIKDVRFLGSVLAVRVHLIAHRSRDGGSARWEDDGGELLVHVNGPAAHFEPGAPARVTWT